MLTSFFTFLHSYAKCAINISREVQLSSFCICISERIMQINVHLVYKGQLPGAILQTYKGKSRVEEHGSLCKLLFSCVIQTLTMSVEANPKLMKIAMRVNRLRALLFSWIQQQKCCSDEGVHLNSSARATSSSSTWASRKTENWRTAGNSLRLGREEGVKKKKKVSEVMNVNNINTV